MAWLKITFDSMMPGRARVHVAGRKRLQEVDGRWIVFDKDIGILATEFDAATFEECAKWLESRRGIHHISRRLP